MAGLAMSKGKRGGPGKEKAAKIVGILFMSRTASHMAHLKTGSYSKHKTLNDFYDNEDEGDDVIELADEIAEVAQGKWGKLDIPFIALEGDINEPADMLEKHLEMILREAEGCDDRALNAIVDVVKGFYLKNIYLLRELV